LSVALGIQNALRMRHIFSSGLGGYTVFLHVISNGTIFENKLLEVKYVC
jgi:hypothetical protein